MANGTPSDWDSEMRWRLVRGEASALGELYDGLAPLVHGIALRLLADEEAAERVVCEVFTDVWENPEAYEPAGGPLRARLAEAARERAERHLRVRARAEGGGGSSEEVERRVHAAAAAARADHAAAAMPDSLRTALELVYVQRLDYRRAAAVLGVGESEARLRLHLGLQLLSTAAARPAAVAGTAEPPGGLPAGPGAAP